MYYMPSTGAVLKDHSAIRAAMPPNIMLPAELQDSDLDFLGIYELRIDDCPIHSAKVFTPAAPVQRAGVWCQPWASRDATVAEIAATRLAGIELLIKGAVDRLNAFAVTRIYGDDQTSPIVAACSYAASPHATYGPEGRYCVTARDETWDVLNQMRDDVLAGRRALPASFAEFESELPELAWPA